MKTLPFLQKDSNDIWSLIVDGKPYFGLGGELHNSASSDPTYLEQKVWPAVKKLGINTVIAPVYWETLEPVEGEFDFTTLELLLKQARHAGVRLVLLWFGLWKNGESFYAPDWVKTNSERFFRIETMPGKPIATVSPFCEEAVAADARAFAALMHRLHALDANKQTVILVQVENEIGVLGGERDCSAAAQAAYESPIPPEVQALYGGMGDWQTAYGEDAPERFMAYRYASSVETIAAAGKAEYPLPLYVNAWLEQFPERPGVYPSGGPTARMIPVWQSCAPSIDFCAPDIYLPDFAGVCNAYTEHDNPLFIPEARRDPVTASNVFYAFGHYNVICFAPFAVEDFFDEAEELDPALLQQLNIVAAAFSCNHTGKYLPASYALLASLEELYLKSRGTGRVHAFLKKSEHEAGCILPLAGCDLQINYLPSAPGKPGSAGMVIEAEDHSFWIFGTRASFTLLPKRASGEQVDFIRLEAGRFEQSVWQQTCILNGDELAKRKFGDSAEIRRVVYHPYEAPVTPR